MPNKNFSLSFFFNCSYLTWSHFLITLLCYYCPDISGNCHQISLFNLCWCMQRNKQI